jgi:O-antigen/teichoic acid export membrane protein
MMGGAAVLVLGWGEPLTAPMAVLLAGAPVVPIWWAQRWHFRRGLSAALRQYAARYATEHWMRTAFPMLLITGFLLLLAQTDLLMIGLLVDAEHVGVYKVAAKTASLVLFPLLAVNAVMAPRFAKAHVNGDTEALQRLASAAAHWIFWPALVAALALTTMSGIALGLFGPAFLQGEPVLWILIVAQLVNAGAGSVGPLLNMTGHQQASAQVYGLCAGSNVVLNAVGIYFLGMIGAAVATTLSTALWNVSLYRLVINRLGLYPSVFDAWRASQRGVR